MLAQKLGCRRPVLRAPRSESEYSLFPTGKLRHRRGATASLCKGRNRFPDVGGCWRGLSPSPSRRWRGSAGLLHGLFQGPPQAWSLQAGRQGARRGKAAACLPAPSQIPQTHRHPTTPLLRAIPGWRLCQVFGARWGCLLPSNYSISPNAGSWSLRGTPRAVCWGNAWFLASLP